MTNDQTLTLIFGDTDDASKAVDHVFTVLAATYGAAWDKSLGNAPINDVKTAWAFQLSAFTHSPAAKRSILWALRNLPERMPGAIEFKNLCRQAPAQEVSALTNEIKADPQRVAAELAKMGQVRDTATGPKEPAHFKQWARDIVANPKGRTPTVVQMARNALSAGG